MRTPIFSLNFGSPLCLVGLLAAVGCTSSPREADLPGAIGASAQPVGTPPVSMMDGGCTSNAQCAMPLIAAGGSHTVAVRSDGTVWAWGQNNFGQLGNGSSGSSSNVPVQVLDLTNVSAIAAGQSHSVALKLDGTVWTWGHNQYGQLGNGMNGQSEKKPVQVMLLSGITAVAAGNNHTIALREDGTVWAWGYNGNGQLGNGSSSGPDQCGAHSPVWCSMNPVQVSKLSGITAVAAGLSHTVALKLDGTVWAWGDNSNGQLGNGSNTAQSTPVQVMASPDAGVALTGVSAVAAGQIHTVALKSDGTVWAWGDNSNGQLGDGSKTDQWTPVKVQNLSHIAAIAAGQFHSVALSSEGEVWAWGLNDSGQLGNSSSSLCGSKPCSKNPIQVSELRDVAAVAAGGWHTIALKTAGTVWAWGDNSGGQLGDGTKSPQTTPVETKDFAYQADGCATVPTCSAGACVSVCNPDAGIIEEPDAGLPDSGSPDAGLPDTGSPDAELADASSFDAGSLDAGADAGSLDSDAALLPDSGSSIYDLGGCGCQQAAAPSALGALALLVAALGPRRRRSR